MQPCSQPRYGLIELEKPTSGESLCETIERARSMVTLVLSSTGSRSSGAQPSSKFSRATVSKRPGANERAPRRCVSKDFASLLIRITCPAPSYPDTVQMNSSGHDARNVGLLAACQAMLFTNNSTLIAINGLAGLSLAPHKWL